MKTTIQKIILGAALLAGLTTQVIAQGTAFTYQGQLSNGGNPASGLYDFVFSLSTAPTGGSQIGSAITNGAVGVTNGLFTVTLDFGPVFTGNALWLALSVRTNGAGAFSALEPLQELTPTPYALFAETAGGVSLGGSYSNAVALTNANNSFNGSYAGNGSGLTNLNSTSLDGLNGTNFWQIHGNQVTAGQFFGSVNNQPIEFWVNNIRALRLEPGNTVNGAPNVIGGSPVNYVSSSVIGATIGGGGAAELFNSYTNSVTGNFGTVGGGAQNAAGVQSTVAGGIYNTANAINAAVGGGLENQAAGNVATVGGGNNNVASGDGSFIGGGGYFDSIFGGNNAAGVCSVVSGGFANAVEPNGSFATIDGGTNN